MGMQRSRQRNLFEATVAAPPIPPSVHAEIAKLLQSLLIEANAGAPRNAVVVSKEDDDDQDHG